MTDVPIDMNQIAATAASDLVKDIAQSIFSKLSKPIEKKWGQITTDFEEMLSAAYAKNAYVRILSSKQTPVKLDKIYVETKFRCETDPVDEKTLMQRVRNGQKVLVLGDGGLGKTFFVKRFWSAVFEHGSGKIPVFVSLRDLNELTDDNLESFLRRTVFPSAKDSEELFKYFCDSGTFIFILDGYDEVVASRRPILQRQLIDFTNKYNHCGYLVSSRETDALTAWDDFFEYHICRFDRLQTLELIDNVEFDKKTKAKFSKQITEEFFDANQSFLSNPLLALMMLITFRDNAKLPTKMSNFYENAFQTLYSLHDGLKGAYLRERRLEKDTFRKLFSIFCLFTYYNHVTSFNEAELREYVEKSKKYLKLNVDTSDVVKEFRESTNLIQLEGFQYSFIHRSFQEYFSAYCAVKIITENVEHFVEEFFERSYDQTFKLAHEIHPDAVEEKFLIPKLEALEKNNKIKKIYLSTASKYQALSDLNWKMCGVISATSKLKSGDLDLETYSMMTGHIDGNLSLDLINGVSNLFGNKINHDNIQSFTIRFQELLANVLMDVFHSSSLESYICDDKLQSLLIEAGDNRLELRIDLVVNPKFVEFISSDFSDLKISLLNDELVKFETLFAQIELEWRAASRFSSRQLDLLRNNSFERSRSIDDLLGI